MSTPTTHHRAHMPAKPIAPITLAALRALRTHGAATVAQLRVTLPEIRSKTLNNLAQMSLAVRDKVEEDRQRQRSATTATPSRASHSQGKGGADEDSDDAIKAVLTKHAIGWATT